MGRENVAIFFDSLVKTVFVFTEPFYEAWHRSQNGSQFGNPQILCWGRDLARSMGK